LTKRQRAILDAYVAPMANGRPPATHQQVAEVIGCCRQTVRLECANIVDAFYAAGVPMRDWRDARDAITDAWARHRFCRLPETTARSARGAPGRAPACRVRRARRVRDPRALDPLPHARACRTLRQISEASASSTLSRKACQPWSCTSRSVAP